MDTSNEYVKMCRAAEEIQAKTAPDGSFLCPPISVGETAYIIRSIEAYQQSWTWLPRQDQLQDMFKGEWNNILDALIKYSDTPLHDNPPAESMEQLWLMFVMEKKYNKVWDRNEWKEEKVR